MGHLQQTRPRVIRQLYNGIDFKMDHNGKNKACRWVCMCIHPQRYKHIHMNTQTDRQTCQHIQDVQVLMPGTCAYVTFHRKATLQMWWRWRCTTGRSLETLGGPGTLYRLRNRGCPACQKEPWQRVKEIGLLALNMELWAKETDLLETGQGNGTDSALGPPERNAASWHLDLSPWRGKLNFCPSNCSDVSTVTTCVLIYCGSTNTISSESPCGTITCVDTSYI